MDARRPEASRALLMVLLACAPGCGARTGLRLWDAGPDAYREPDVIFETGVDVPLPPDVPAPVDVPIIPGACVPQALRVERQSGEIMIVIDRSGSMGDPFDVRVGPRSRWIAMGDELAAALQPFQSTIAMGATFYPVVEGVALMDCQVPDFVDVQPALNNARPIIRILSETNPGGSTPTYSALRLTSQYLAGRTSGGRARFMMLATDGAPNCNPSGFFGDEIEPTLQILRESLARGIPTYIIGFDDPNDPTLATALAAMAYAGGRPNMTAGAPAYFSARRSGDLTAAFSAVQRAVSSCVLQVAPAPVTPGHVALAYAGVPIARDSGHRDGWDFTDPTSTQITLFGPSCERVQATGGTFAIAVDCPDR